MNQEENQADQMQEQPKKKLGIFVGEDGTRTPFLIQPEKVQELAEREIANKSNRMLFVDGEPLHGGNALMTRLIDVQRELKHYQVDEKTLGEIVI